MLFDVQIPRHFAVLFVIGVVGALLPAGRQLRLLVLSLTPAPVAVAASKRRGGNNANNASKSSGNAGSQSRKGADAGAASGGSSDGGGADDGVAAAVPPAAGDRRSLGGWMGLVLIGIWAFYLVVFHALSNMPLDQPLLYGVQARYSCSFAMPTFRGKHVPGTWVVMLFLAAWM